MSNEVPESSPTPQDLRLAELLKISDERAFTEAEVAEILELQRLARQKGPTLAGLFKLWDQQCDPWWRTPGMK